MLSDASLPVKNENQESTANTRKPGPLAGLKGGPILACIDMGTNSFHMIVCRATPERDHFDIITRSKEAVPFFRRSLAAHYIDESAMRSSIRIVKEMIKHAEDKGASSVIAVATSAVRESNNGEEVLQQICKEAKIEAKMISGKEEARLIYVGVLWSMPELDGTFAIIDIGGGSTEVIVGNRKEIFFSESYKLGAARLTQRFFRKGVPTVETIKELHEEVRGVMRPAQAKIENAGGFAKLIGTSGTIQALAKLDRDLFAKEHNDSHLPTLSMEHLSKLVSYIERAALSGEKIPSISTDRSQTILAGSIVLLEIMLALDAPSLTVCPAALREGVIVDRFLQSGWLNCGLESHSDPRSASVHHLLDKYHGDLEHAEQVAKLATEIFLKTQEVLHEHPKETGHLLWSAAMLHDVGMFIGRNGHHKHSYYLIRHAGLLGYSEEEVEIIANIARYHRGSEPKESHLAYWSLPPNIRILVQDMAAILRIAEALDRSHRQLIPHLSIELEKQNRNQTYPLQRVLYLVLPAGETYEAESWALNEKKALFEKQFNVKLSIKIGTRIPIT
jgi:exopolyphosphatase / guanosine-5'-triphosphate,3'-diphosphate pyrophosphatase